MIIPSAGAQRMNRDLNPAENQACTAHKESYEKPKVITFGTVSKITLGAGGSVADGKSGNHKAKA
jgi:hypothetical protein